MARSVKPWKGRTDDTKVPPRVRLRVLQAKGHKCHKCGRIIAAGERWTCEHLIALINGGANAEVNLDVTCEICLPEKNAADMAIKSQTYAMARKNWLPRKAKRPMPGSRASGWQKKMDGTVVRRT